tara:strand:+ start:420 stop:599 length:180 start_codon:yes stop_codon:yes gene_type:complete
MLSKIANSKENYFEIDRKKNYVKMRISLRHYSFDHSFSDNNNWWKVNFKDNNSFTIKLL